MNHQPLQLLALQEGRYQQSPAQTNYKPVWDKGMNEQE